MTDSKSIDLVALRKAAEAATPGPWEHDYGSVSTPMGDDVVGIEEKGTGYDSYRCLVLSRANGDYIAAANPAILLALLDRLEAAERSQWTHHSDQLPDSDVSVLAVSHEADYVVVRLECTDDSEGNGEPYWAADGGDVALCSYPHWMPLRTPPETPAKKEGV